MFHSPKIDSVREWVLVLLVHRFDHGEQKVRVSGEQVAFNWMDWIHQKSGGRPRPSNISRRFRELREEWREQEDDPGENTSALAKDVGIVQIDRIQYSPLLLEMVQSISFTKEDSSVFVTAEEAEEMGVAA
jgi:hypothetical protein